ncbi:uncharacterized protein LOC144477563, partial [Augochlora pura]
MLSSRGDFKATLPCLVIEHITAAMPNVPVDRASVHLPRGLVLADPDFDTPGPIDLLIGAGLFWDLLCIGQLRVGVGNLIWQKTRLGWVLGGSLQWSQAQGRSSATRTSHVVTNAALESAIAQFWEVEEVKPSVAPVNDPCEQHFVENTRRDETGRFVVSIPFNERINELGESRSQAERRLLNLERKFRKEPELRSQYRDFLREYLELGHMTRLDAKAVGGVGGNFYLPHHAVMKKDSTTTKLRVVFDGSAKTSSGVSLNSAQVVGPPVQDELLSILLRFRKHAIVIAADVSKMYRQILVREQDRRYQRILWRFSENDAIGEYCLNTVTYGTASASYLATRVLNQIGRGCARSFPHASKVIQRDFYVDDLLTGCEELEEALELRRSLETILGESGFPLRKWASNDPRLVESGADDAQGLKFRSLDREPKTLGLLWSMSNDELGYCVESIASSRITKRRVLAEIAQIFDPLGLIAPVIIRAKIFMQELWQGKVGWDESLSQDLHSRWVNFRRDLAEITTVQIPRRVLSSYVDVDMHGFADASERAYGAAVYLRSRASDGRWVVRLLCAKSRVAPLKTISVPRLELCGAVLLARLIAKVRDALGIAPMKVFCWTDSQVALAWIKGSPSRWKTFVANRVSEIQTVTNTGEWFHVISADNPADLLSRGTSSTSLSTNELWWHGPSWLTSDQDRWPVNEIPDIDAPEERPIKLTQLSVAVNHSLVTDILSRYSNYGKILRILAYAIRFCENSRGRGKVRKTGRGDRLPPCVEELVAAERIAIRAAQGAYLGQEVRQLRERGTLDGKGPTASLQPFLDDHGIIRVGGRLQNATIPFEQRHPILIPSAGPLAALLVRREHLRLLHAGYQQTSASIHQRYWIVSDNGTNFIGARNELNDLGRLLASQVHNDKISQALAEEQVEWHLIPPRAPHFGGLWERGVRSVKAHLKR